METNIVVQKSNWKPKVLAVGGLFGLAGGLLAAFLLVKKAETEDKEPEFSPADVFKIAMLVLVTVSRVTKLGTE
ncbi:MAG: hypothetical protein ACOYYS_00810 [Chloroflexota bacterium]